MVRAVQGEKCAILVKEKPVLLVYAFQNVLAESCFELLAQILACLRINKDRGSHGKLHLRQYVQGKKKGCKFLCKKWWLILRKYSLKTEIQNLALASVLENPKRKSQQLPPDISVSFVSGFPFCTGHSFLLIGLLYFVALSGQGPGRHQNICADRS